MKALINTDGSIRLRNPVVRRPQSSTCHGPEKLELTTSLGPTHSAYCSEYTPKLLSPNFIASLVPFSILSAVAAPQQGICRNASALPAALPVALAVKALIIRFFIKCKIMALWPTKLR